MNWRSTALVSGASVFATWLASAPAVRQPAATTAAPLHQAAETSEAAADIVQQADRLRARLNAVAAYHEPARNPFRFGEIRSIARATVPIPVPMESAPARDVADPPILQITLSGIAEDAVDGQVVRTAVIRTPDDLLLVKEGDAVTGLYQVARITADSVDLKGVADDAVVRLVLKP